MSISCKATTEGQRKKPGLAFCEYYDYDPNAGTLLLCRPPCHCDHYNISKDHISQTPTSLSTFTLIRTTNATPKNSLLIK